MTPSNSYRFVWTDAAVNRDTNNLVTASIELFWNGDHAVEIEGGDVIVTQRVLPFEHDGFGQDDAWSSADGSVCMRVRRTMNRRTKMRRTFMIALAMYSCLAGQTAPAQMSGYTDDEVKAQFVEAGMFCQDILSRWCNRKQLSFVHGLLAMASRLRTRLVMLSASMTFMCPMRSSRTALLR